MLSRVTFCIIFAKKRVMKLYYIRLITILGLSIILLIQFVWLYNSYTFVRNEIIMKTSDLLEYAINEETFSRLTALPKGTMVTSRPKSEKSKNIPEFAYMQESLIQLGMPMSLDSIARIYKRILEEKMMPNEFSLSILRNSKVVKQTGIIKSSKLNIETNQIPIRKDHSLSIQARLTNPQRLFFEKMGTLLISTTILIIFVFSCVIYQIKVIYRLNKIFQIREDFSYAMIHDMKTPLSTIFMTLNFLHSGRLDDKPEMKEKYYKIAESEADHLLTLTNKVLTISKLENHKLEMVKEEVPLAPLIEKLTDKFTAKTSKPIHFTVNLKATEAYADKEYLEEVISNLIDNAIKYSKETVEIQISSESNELYTILKVHDNGLGISKEDQSIIFNKYERAAAIKRNRKGGAAGFGLGLNFVEQVITAHEGKVTVNSIEREFTEFTIYLPQVMQKI